MSHPYHQGMTGEESAKNAPLEQVEFGINDVNLGAAQDEIRKALDDLNGVRDVQFVGNGAVVTFNPLGITKEEICTAIRRSGHRATEITTEANREG